MTNRDDRTVNDDQTSEPRTGQLDLATVRRRLQGKTGPDYWRSLEELSGSPGFEELLHREFPRFAAEWPTDVSRRRFLQLMAASVALGGLTACTRQPAERLVPYVQQPAELTPGRSQQYATAFRLGGYASGILAESHLGRPTKIEGNELHPASLGATDLFAQASVLGLYDPDRSQTVRHLSRIGTWRDFLAEARTLLRGGGEGGPRVALLTETVTSPTLAATIGGFLERFPRSRWVSWEPVNRDSVRAGVRTAFGVDAETRYDFARADVVLSLDADPVTAAPGSVRYARDLASRRRPTPERPEMSRLYALESTPTAFGSLADHRQLAAPHQIARALLHLARRLGVEGVPAAGAAPTASEGRLLRWMDAAIRDLATHRGRSLVVVGDWATPDVHAVVLAINERLGNLGFTIRLQEPVAAGGASQIEELRNLVGDMRAGRVDALIVLEANPVYNAPADLEFALALREVPMRIRLGLYDDETSELCHWHLPASHDLEAWGDARAYDGTATLIQPLIEPLYGTRSALELVAALAGEEDSPDGYELVRGHWVGRLGASDPEGAWRRALHDGVVPGSEAPTVEATLAIEAVGVAATRLAARSAGSSELTLVFRPDPTIWDGRFANLGWLQECPKPASKLTWDNALTISPATAERLGVETEQLVRIEHGGRAVELPVWVQPGQADGTLTVTLGYGRRRAGRVGNRTGFDLFPLRTGDDPWEVDGVSVTATGSRYQLVSTQLHANMGLESQQAEARHLLRSVDLREFVRHPELVHEMGHAPTADESLYPDDHAYEGYAWGLAIDLNACTGCNACVVACVAENNIPVVGKAQVAAGREMHWIRIDRYFHGDLDSAALHNQPVLCMHCENAPCEVVCPVGATLHSDEGLNDMIYNRCVGTRYCSNNCPYKVRRFNFFNYNARTPNDADEAPVLKLMRNPDVTVRSRGVMEKCTYCVQRIERAKIDAKVESRTVRDGEIRTACQQACPSQAIAFGDVNDPESTVSRWKAEPRDYSLLADLGTRPRTTYLARVRNPSPNLEEGA